MGGIQVNDRAVSILEQYDIEILKTRKGRGTILCESREGLFTLKEYTGSAEKAEIQDLVLTKLQAADSFCAESILKNREGSLITEDVDGTGYMVKTWFEGRECNVKDRGECEKAVSVLASLHNMTTIQDAGVLRNLPVFSLAREYERHNKELKRVRRFLKEKSQKTEFEIFLNRHFDFFLDQAQQILEDYSHYSMLEDEEAVRSRGTLCHGDYQYHNILVTENDTAVINFEKLLLDSPIRDLYLFMRKVLEKSNWSQSTGERLLQAYDRIRTLSLQDRIGLYYRFAYPEKFWKIVNFYYNSGKAWIPGKNMEKLEKVLSQEKEKQQFLDEVLRKV